MAAGSSGKIITSDNKITTKKTKLNAEVERTILQRQIKPTTGGRCLPCLSCLTMHLNPSQSDIGSKISIKWNKKTIQTAMKGERNHQRNGTAPQSFHLMRSQVILKVPMSQLTIFAPSISV
jgi:hypothetical protein